MLAGRLQRAHLASEKIQLAWAKNRRLRNAAAQIIQTYVRARKLKMILQNNREAKFMARDRLFFCRRIAHIPHEINYGVWIDVGGLAVVPCWFDLWFRLDLLVMIPAAIENGEVHHRTRTVVY